PGTKGTVEGPVLVVEPPLPSGGGRGAGGGRAGGGGAGGQDDLAAIAQAGSSPPPMPTPPAGAPKVVTQADLDAYLASIKPKVRGAVVFYGPHTEVAENFVPAPLRRPDDSYENAGGNRGRGGAPPAAPGGGRGAAAPEAQGLTAGDINNQVAKFLV